MASTTGRQDAPGDHPFADAYERSSAALDSAEQLLRAHLGGRPLDGDARAGISRTLSGALRDLARLELAADARSDEVRQAGAGLRRFDELLAQIADAGLLPER